MKGASTEVLVCPTCHEPESFLHTDTGYECPVCGATMIETEPTSH